MNDFKCTARITNELEIKKTANDLSVINFGLAIARDKERNGQSTDFINATAYGKTAELINHYLQKGSKAIFSGELCSDTYQKDGKNVYTHYILINRVEFIDFKKDTNNKEETSPEN